MKHSTQTISGIEFARVNNDVNGNPRYVCHFLSIPLTPVEECRVDNQAIISKALGQNKPVISYQYEAAIKKANTIGGRKYHNKQYGGGIVFQSYNIADLAKSIIALRNK